MIEALVDVGWTSSRPVRPDEHVSAVRVIAESVLDCSLVAAQIAACRPQCEMVTSTKVIGSVEVITADDWIRIGFYPSADLTPPF